MMKIRLRNQQKTVRMPPVPVRQLARWLTHRVQTSQSGTAVDAVEITLADDEGIRQVNRRVFLRDRATDVITVLYRELPADGCRISAAEIFVNVDCALRLGRGRHADTVREVALYIAHGLDHLFGGRDDTPRRRRAMLRRERQWVREAEHAGLLDFPATPRKSKPTEGRTAAKK